MNWQWPYKPGKNTLAPWYVIVWRLIWFPAYIFGLSLTFVAITMSQGLSEARSFWRWV